MSNRFRTLGGFAVAALATLLYACGGDSTPTGPVVTGAVSSVTISGPSSTVVIGGTLLLAAVSKDAQGHTVSGKAATWTSSNPAVATVNSSTGLVSGLVAGTVTISATVDGISGSTLLAVATASSSASVQADVSQQFKPKQVDISAGGTVTWDFSTLTHNVTFVGAASGTPANIPDQTSTSVSRTFPTPGTFDYQCTLHPGMTGTVIVH
jgi:plastocyanin